MPVFKRNRGHIFGVQFSAKEQKAIDAEILRQCAEFDRKNANEIDALVLWLLHEKFGFGKKRLRAFYDYFLTEIDALAKWYEMGDEDKAWLCTYKLKQYERESDFSTSYRQGFGKKSDGDCVRTTYYRQRETAEIRY